MCCAIMEFDAYTVRDQLGISGPIGFAVDLSDDASARGYVITDSFEGPNQRIRFYGQDSVIEALKTDAETGLSWWNDAGQLQYNAQFATPASPLNVLFDVNGIHDWGVQTTATNPNGGSLVTKLMCRTSSTGSRKSRASTRTASPTTSSSATTARSPPPPGTADRSPATSARCSAPISAACSAAIRWWGSFRPAR